MGWCAKAWWLRVESEILSRYPGVYVYMARTYDRPHVTNTRLQPPPVIPGVSRPETPSDPLRALRKWLAAYDGPLDQLYVQYHPLGGFAWTSTNG